MRDVSQREYAQRMKNIYKGRAIPSTSPALNSESLRKFRTELDEIRIEHVNIVGDFLKVNENFYSLDTFFVAIAQRSYELVDGFISMLDEVNFSVMAPILRMQIDNLIRASYVSRSRNPDEIASDFMTGTEFRKMKSPDGSKLTDYALKDEAIAHHPWIFDVYEKTSGWIHLSPAHVHTSIKTERVPDGALVKLHFPRSSEDISVEALEDICFALIKVTQELFEYLEGWYAVKGLPKGESRPPRNQR